ncbi:MAG: sulfite exporter TauE/SafE family protein [Candidatus Thermoplasmatota archaeon]
MSLIMVLVALAVLAISAIYPNLGLGGGYMYVPLLILFAGMEKNTAVALSLVLVASGAVAAAINHHRAGMVEMRLAACMSVGAVAGALFGVFFNLHINQWVFSVLFTSVLFAVCIRIAYDLWRKGDEADRPLPMGRRRRLAAAVASSVLAGFLAGALGVGGGFLYVPILCYLVGTKTKVAVGTSSMVIISTGIAGFLTYFIGGASALSADAPFYAVALAPFSIAGAYIGTRIGVRRLNAMQIKALFLSLTLLMGAVMLLDLLL